MTPRTEQQLLDCTIGLAKQTGWFVHHDRPARTANGYRTAIQGHAGFPDLVLARAGVVLFRELKGYDSRGRLGKPTDLQRDWGHALAPRWPYCTHLDYEVQLPNGQRTPRFDIWTPDHWDDVIVPTLTQRKDAQQ